MTVFGIDPGSASGAVAWSSTSRRAVAGRFKTQVNNDNGAAPIWEQAGEAGK